MTLSNYDGFTFDGKSTNSNEFGLTICALDKFDTSTGLEREVVGTELNANRNVKEAFSTKYSNPLTFSIQLAKKDGSFITEQEKNKIISWLYSPKNHKQLNFFVDVTTKNNGMTDSLLRTNSPSTPELLNIQENVWTQEEIAALPPTIYYNVIFTNLEVETVQGEIAALTLTAECDAPWGYSETKTAIKEVETEQHLDINSLTITFEGMDTKEYVYPIIELSEIDENTIYIRNKAEIKEIIEDSVNNTSTIVYKMITLKNLTPFKEEGKKLYIDCLNQLIYDETGRLIPLSDLGWNKSIQQPVQKGDINKDGKINIEDLQMLRWHIVGDITLSQVEDDQETHTSQFTRADMNGDGVLDIEDVVLLRKKILEPRSGDYINTKESVYWPRLFDTGSSANHQITFSFLPDDESQITTDFKAKFIWRYPIKTGVI